MTTFMLMRVNYDDREIRPQDRYSMQVTKAVSAAFDKRYQQSKIGGKGFHEGLNFAECDDGRVRVYIPPRPPAEDRIDDDFVIFTFTYATETGEQGSRIIGVHAGASIETRTYKSIRPDHDMRYEKIVYHASAPSNLCTLFLTKSGSHLPVKEGRHLPSSYRWGTGHRYFREDDEESIHLLRNILMDARKAAEQAETATLNAAAKKYAVREVEVINRILATYFSGQPAIWNEAQKPADIEELLRKGGKTTRKQLIEARLGQGRFRRDLEARWGYACAVTDCNLRKVLRASHMKPWSKSKDAERTDPCNGLLLEANLDALFDSYLISFEDGGRILLSRKLSPHHRKALGLSGSKLRKQLNEKELQFLRHHRKEFLKRENDQCFDAG